MNFRNKYLLFPAFCILLMACSSALYLPTISDANRSGISTDTLIMGRKLYVAHCGACHNLYLPEQFSQMQWEKKMPEMQHKAKITETEAQLISNFLMARSKPE